jgi:hypothetical protein
MTADTTSATVPFIVLAGAAPQLGAPPAPPAPERDKPAPAPAQPDEEEDEEISEVDWEELTRPATDHPEDETPAPERLDQEE